MSEDARIAAIKAALDGYVDPYLGDSLGTAQAVDFNKLGDVTSRSTRKH